jgi:predicted glycosyltransferase
VLLTAWDRGQAALLARVKWQDAIVTGRDVSRSVLRKGTTIWTRAVKLSDIAGRWGADVAVSHNSYSQIVAGRLLRRPVLTMMDYEHQPANHLAFRLATRVMVPEVIPSSAVRRFGAVERKLRRYPFLKEEVALASFEPDPHFRERLDVGEEVPLITVRLAPEGALYHRKANPILGRLVPALSDRGACVLISPRTLAQAERFGEIRGTRVLAEPVSGTNLLFHSDLFFGGGGTMTREAAVLGTPSFSVFTGKPSAVDRELQRRGSMKTVHSPEDVKGIQIRRLPPRVWQPDRSILPRFVDVLLAVVGEMG